MSNATSGTAVVVALNWCKGRTGPPAPCVLCTRPALCRSPARGVPCHKGCAEAWITTHARDAGHRAQLVRAHTPGGGR
ncbi:MAG: hypothetical protein ACR2FU_10620 [Streptosporangiaceae bacterium]